MPSLGGFRVVTFLSRDQIGLTESRSQLKKPTPDDLIPILTKDEEKQKQIHEKAGSDAVSENARVVGRVNSPALMEPQQLVAAVKMATNPPPQKPNQPTPTKLTVKPDALAVERQNMFIQDIPPFKDKPSEKTKSDVVSENTGTIGQASASSSMGTPPQADSKKKKKKKKTLPRPTRLR